MMIAAVAHAVVNCFAASLAGAWALDLSARGYRDGMYCHLSLAIALTHLFAVMGAWIDFSTPLTVAIVAVTAAYWTGIFAPMCWRIWKRAQEMRTAV